MGIWKINNLFWFSSQSKSFLLSQCFLIDWLIDWIVFYTVSAIYQQYNSGPMLTAGLALVSNLCVVIWMSREAFNWNLSTLTGRKWLLLITKMYGQGQSVYIVLLSFKIYKTSGEFSWAGTLALGIIESYIKSIVWLAGASRQFTIMEAGWSTTYPLDLPHIFRFDSFSTKLSFGNEKLLHNWRSSV